MEPPAATATVSLIAQHEIAVAIGSDHDILVARQRGRALVSQLGFSATDATLVATAVSELARNIFLYAQRGEIVLTTVEHHGRQGVLIVARDEGPGITEAQQAAIAASLHNRDVAFGLCAIKRLVDEFEIVSKIGQGTTVTIKKWMS